jgi:hypothetical protein
MFFRGLKLKNIAGTVFYDRNCNGMQDEGEAGIPRVRMALYVNVEDSPPPGEGITVTRSRPVSWVFTGRDGSFRAAVPEGNFTLSVDTGTLPEGKGVETRDFRINDGIPDHIKIPVTDVADMDTGRNDNWRFAMGEEIKRAPVLRNSKGCAVYGKCSISYDGSKRKMIAESGNVKKEFPVEILHPHVSNVEKVEAEYRSGLINSHERIRFLLYSLFDKNKLPHSIRSSSLPIKSGTILIEEIKEYISSRYADRELVSEAIEYLRNSIPKLDKSYKSPSGFFKIHYTLSGKHSVPQTMAGVPEYIIKTGEAFDNVLQITCEKRGFLKPAFEKSKGAYDVYVYDLGGVYGYTASTGYYKTGGNRIAASSYIAVDNNYSPSKGFENPRDDSMRVTAAHEFFHAVQYMYNARADKWWKEASATWNEDEIYPYVNDYIRYLGDYFSSPNRSIDSYTYSGVLFAKHISENFRGYETIRKIWETHKGTNSSVSAIDRALKSLGNKKGITDALNMFSAYSFSPAQYFEDGMLWKERINVQNTYSDYPVISQQNRLDHLSTDYQLFRYYATGGRKLEITVDSGANVNWGIKLQKRRKTDGLCDISYIKPDAMSKRMEIAIDNIGNYSEVCLIQSNLDKARDGAAYSYSAKLI